MATNENDNRTAIILCAGQNGRAVLYGYVDELPEPGQPVTMYEARMVIWWSRECGGLFGLAATGPATDTRITHPIPRLVETVWQEVMVCAEAGVEAINAWPGC